MQIDFEAVAYIITNIATVGIVWGIYKNKIDTLIKDQNALKEKMDTKSTEIDIKLKEVITEISDTVDEAIKEHNLNIKEINKELGSIDNRCASRSAYITAIPQVMEDLNKLKIEVSSLPSKLSSEIAKSFSEEYQRIISNIVTRNSKSSNHWEQDK